MYTQENAQQTLTQLGGPNRLKAMIGAKNFSYDQSFVGFKFMRSRGMNHIKIHLNSMDTYDMEFIRIHGDKITTVETHQGVYHDGLISIFENTTGLALRL